MSLKLVRAGSMRVGTLAVAIAGRTVVSTTGPTAVAATVLSTAVAGLRRRGTTWASARRAAMSGAAWCASRCAPRRADLRRRVMRSSWAGRGMRAVIRAPVLVPVWLAVIAGAVATTLVVIRRAVRAANANRHFRLNHCGSVSISVIAAVIPRSAIRVGGTAAEEGQSGASRRKAFDSMRHGLGCVFVESLL